jgi:hypothetical protein
MPGDWKEELYQLLIGHFSDGPFDEGIGEIAAIAAYHPETHEQYLAAIQGAYDAALAGDESVVEAVNEGNARYVADLAAATAFLKELRAAYLSRYQQEVARKR